MFDLVLLFPFDIRKRSLLVWADECRYQRRSAIPPLRRRTMSGEQDAMQTRPSLLLRLRNGSDADAWRTFIGIYAPLVYGFARRHGLQDADASDLTQEVSGEVCRAIRSFEYQPERGRFRDWLLVI